MSNLVGSVHFNSTIDGSKMPADAQREGDRAGKAGSKSFDKSWKKGFEKTLNDSAVRSYRSWVRSGSKDGNAYGNTYGRAFTTRLDRFMKEARDNFERLRLDPGFMDDFAKKFDNAGDAVRKLRGDLDALDGQVNNRALESGRRQIDEWTKSQENARRSTADLRLEQSRHNLALAKLGHTLDDIAAKRDRQIETNDRIGNSFRKLGRILDVHGGKWRNLSANTRQWTLIIGAVAVAAENIAVLGSAAGAGLIALGGGIAALGVGAAGAVAVFANLFQDIKKAPAAMRPTIRSSWTCAQRSARRTTRSLWRHSLA